MAADLSTWLSLLLPGAIAASYVDFGALSKIFPSRSAALDDEAALALHRIVAEVAFLAIAADATTGDRLRRNRRFGARHAFDGLSSPHRVR